MQCFPMLRVGGTVSAAFTPSPGAREGRICPRSAARHGGAEMQQWERPSPTLARGPDPVLQQLEDCGVGIGQGSSSDAGGGHWEQEPGRSSLGWHCRARISFSPRARGQGGASGECMGHHDIRALITDAAWDNYRAGRSCSRAGQGSAHRRPVCHLHPQGFVLQQRVFAPTAVPEPW